MGTFVFETSIILISTRIRISKCHSGLSSSRAALGKIRTSIPVASFLYLVVGRHLTIVKETDVPWALKLDGHIKNNILHD